MVLRRVLAMEMREQEQEVAGVGSHTLACPRSGPSPLNLSAERGTNVLKLSETRSSMLPMISLRRTGAIYQGAEAWDLTSDGSPNLCLIVFQEFHECRHQVP